MIKKQETSFQEGVTCGWLGEEIPGHRTRDDEFKMGYNTGRKRKDKFLKSLNRLPFRIRSLEEFDPREYR